MFHSRSTIVYCWQPTNKPRFEMNLKEKKMYSSPLSCCGRPISPLLLQNNFLSTTLLCGTTTQMFTNNFLSTTLIVLWYIEHTHLAPLLCGIYCCDKHLLVLLQEFHNNHCMFRHLWSVWARRHSPGQAID